MSNEKRKAGDYTIINSIHIGNVELVLGEKMNDKDGNFYLVGNYIQNDLFARYENCLVSNDFTEVADVFADRLKEQTTQLKAERDEPTFTNNMLIKSDCTSLSGVENIENKVIVIKPDVLRPEHRMATKQLYLATGGNGTRANSLGTAVFCKNLYTGKETRFERYDILGMVEKNNLPNWAKEKLSDLEQKQKSKSHKEVER